MLKIKYISLIKISIILLYTMDVRQSNNKIELSYFIQYIYCTEYRHTVYLVVIILYYIFSSFV